MEPDPNLASVSSPDPSIAQSRNDIMRDRPVGPGEPNARVSAATEASRGWPAGAGHDGEGSGAGRGGSAGVGRGEADLPRIDDSPARPPSARCCGARTRSGPGCRGLAMENGRCRMHGGGSTGPRTPEGLAKLVAARTKHGRYGAAERALRRHHRTFVERNRLLAEAEALWPYLSPDLRARLDRVPAELEARVHPSRLAGVAMAGTVAGEAGLGVVVPVVGRDARGRFAAGPRVVVPPRVLRGRAAEREVARAEAAALAPWKAGIAQALMARGMVLEGRRAVRDVAVRNDPIGGRATGGGRAAIGVGEQRPCTRPDGGGGDGTVRAARRVVRVVEVRNDPIRGSAMGGGGAASGAGEQRPYTRHEGAGGGAWDDGAIRGAGDGVARVAETRHDPITSSTTGGEFANGAVASRPHAWADGDAADVAVRAARRAAGIARTHNDPIPGNATGGEFAIGAVASRPQARPDGAGDDSAARAGPGAACGAGVAATGGAGFGVLPTAPAGLVGKGWGMPALIAAAAAGRDVQAAFDALCG